MSEVRGVSQRDPNKGRTGWGVKKFLDGLAVSSKVWRGGMTHSGKYQ